MDWKGVTEMANKATTLRHTAQEKKCEKHAGKLNNRPRKTDPGVKVGMGFPSSVAHQTGQPE